jgi:hypothetical protein
MFKRLFWLMVGAGFGFGASFWVMRAVRSTVERYSPQRVTDDMAQAARRFGADLKAAVADGREAMREYERDMHERLTAEANGHTEEVGAGS